MTFVKLTGTSNDAVNLRSPCQSCGKDYNPELAKKRFSSSNS